MLYIVLVIAAVLLLTTNVSVARTPRGEYVRPVVYVAGWVIACGVLPFCLMIVSPAVWELGSVLVVLAAATVWTNRKRAFHPLSVVAFAAVFGVNAWLAWSQDESLRSRYPFESLAERLPDRPADPERPAVVAESVDHLENEDYSGSWEIRANSLRELHENTTRGFVSYPGFGVGRMTRMSEGAIRHGERGNRPVPQPGPHSVTSETLATLGSAAPAGDDFRTLHFAGVTDFVHPNGFGYFRDRRQVAGFESHRFSRVPEATAPWRVRTIDLIGLVVHPEPVAYVSANLPQMDELRAVPTRRLLPVEEAGLAELRRGSDLHVRTMPGGSVRLIGAIRSLKQCVNCHQGQRGDLLGAFSYELRRE